MRLEFRDNGLRFVGKRLGTLRANPRANVGLKIDEASHSLMIFAEIRAAWMRRRDDRD